MEFKSSEYILGLEQALEISRPRKVLVLLERYFYNGNVWNIIALNLSNNK